jgi:hypothetical protein
MLHERDQWQSRIKAVEREHAATRFAILRLQEEARRDPTILRSEVTVREVNHAAERLEATYIIRLFAEFESGLRRFWAATRTTDPPAEHLLDAIAAARRVPSDQIMQAHAVREHRNALVHQRQEATSTLSIRDARGHLCRFFSFLPSRW